MMMRNFLYAGLAITMFNRLYGLEDGRITLWSKIERDGESFNAYQRAGTLDTPNTYFFKASDIISADGDQEQWMAILPIQPFEAVAFIPKFREEISKAQAAALSRIKSRSSQKAAALQDRRRRRIIIMATAGIGTVLTAGYLIARLLKNRDQE